MVACLEAGLHLLCEKPLAVTLRGCTRIVETAKRAGKVVSVAENYRRDPINRLIRALIDDGAIGTPCVMFETGVNGRPVKLHLDDGTVIDDERILEHAPSYRLSPLAAELFGGDRVWTYTPDLNEVDRRIVATEYHELAACVRTGAAPELTAEEGRADVALVYAPFEAGRLGRAVTLDELIDGHADGYLREIDAMLGLLDGAPA